MEPNEQPGEDEVVREGAPGKTPGAAEGDDRERERREAPEDPGKTPGAAEGVPEPRH